MIFRKTAMFTPKIHTLPTHLSSVRMQVKTLRLRLCSYVVAARLHALIETRLNEGFRIVSSGGSDNHAGRAPADPLQPSVVLVLLWQPQVLLLYLPTNVGSGAARESGGRAAPSSVRVDVDVIARSDFCQLFHGLRRLHARGQRMAANVATAGPPADESAESMGPVAAAAALLAVASVDTEHGTAASAVRKLPLTAIPGPDVMSERFALRQSAEAVDRLRIVALSQFVHVLAQVDAVSERLSSPPLGAYYNALSQLYSRRNASLRMPALSSAAPSFGSNDATPGSDGAVLLLDDSRVLISTPLATLYIPLASLSVAAWHRWFHVERLEIVMRRAALHAGAIASPLVAEPSDATACWGCVLYSHVHACVLRWADIELPWSHEVFRWAGVPFSDSKATRGSDSMSAGPLLKVVWPEAVRKALRDAQRPVSEEHTPLLLAFDSSDEPKRSATIATGFSEARSRKARGTVAEGPRKDVGKRTQPHLIEDRMASQVIAQVPSPLPVVIVRVSSPAGCDGGGVQAACRRGGPRSCRCGRDGGSALVVLHVALYGLAPPTRTSILVDLKKVVSTAVLQDGTGVEAATRVSSAASPGEAEIKGPVRSFSTADEPDALLHGRASSTTQSTSPRDTSPRASAPASEPSPATTNLAWFPEVCTIPLARTIQRRDAVFFFDDDCDKSVCDAAEDSDFFDVHSFSSLPTTTSRSCAGSALPPSVLRRAFGSRLWRWGLLLRHSPPLGLPQLSSDAARCFHDFLQALTLPHPMAALEVATRVCWQWLAWSGCVFPGCAQTAFPVSESTDWRAPIVLGHARLFCWLPSILPTISRGGVMRQATNDALLAQLQLALVLLPPDHIVADCYAGLLRSTFREPLAAPETSSQNLTDVEVAFGKANELPALEHQATLSAVAHSSLWRVEVRGQLWLENRGEARLLDDLCAGLDTTAAIAFVPPKFAA